MGKHLSTLHVAQIVSLLDGWPTGMKLTWSQLVKLIGRRLSIQTTRQTLARYEEVKGAFGARKAALRREAPAAGDERGLAQRLRRVIGENDRLREENARYRERFVRWQYNTYKHGLKKHQLEEALPKVDRERSA